MTPTENNTTKSKLEELFKYKSDIKSVQDIISKGFVAAEFKKGKALIVGMNPSFTSNAENGSFLYKVDDAVIKYPRYYKKFQDLLIDTKYENDWTYIDLFHFRETKQKNIQKFFKKDIHFLVEQLRLSHKIISEINPEIIIVCNSEAANYFGKNIVKTANGYDNVWFGYEFKFNVDYGVDVISGRLPESIIENKDENIINKPILFSGSLTYMSRFDKKRISWQIKRIGTKPKELN